MEDKIQIQDTLAQSLRKKAQPMQKKAVGETYWTEERIAAEAEALRKWAFQPTSFYLTSFATRQGYTSATLQYLKKKSAFFLEAYEYARESIEHNIVDAALYRKVEANFAKFLLSNKHGWTEKQEVKGDKQSPLALVFGMIDKGSKDLVNEEGSRIEYKAQG